MVAAFSFAKSSQKLHTWFINTGLYKKNLESYVAGKGMTKAAKARVMATITLLMSVGFVMMLLKALYVPCIILGCIWVFHIVYFLFGRQNPQGSGGLTRAQGGKPGAFAAGHGVALSGPADGRRFPTLLTIFAQLPVRISSDAPWRRASPPAGAVASAAAPDPSRTLAASGKSAAYACLPSAQNGVP